MGVALVVVAGVVGYLIASSGPSAAELAAGKARLHAQQVARQHAVWKRQANACHQAVGPFLAAVEAVDGHTVAGVNEDAFTMVLGDAESTSRQSDYALSQVSASCGVIVASLKDAMSQYEDASSAWIACVNDPYSGDCVSDATDTGQQVQDDWSTAGEDLDAAERGFTAMANGQVPGPASDSAASGPGV